MEVLILDIYCIMIQLNLKIRAKIEIYKYLQDMHYKD